MAELEAELQAQLAEQEEAVVGVKQLLEDDPDSEEIGALLAELQEGIQHTTDALLGLKRQRLLAELDAMQGGDAATQQQQQQRAEAGAASGSLPQGSLCIFRHTDGRHYFGRVLGSAGADGVLQLEFCLPTRAFQLEPLELPAAACQPAPATALRPDAAALQPGTRVTVQPQGQKLWEAAEVTEVDAAGQRVAAVLVGSQRRLVLQLSAVALSPHAHDPHASGSDGEHGGGGSDGDGSSDDAGSASEDEGGGSDMEESEEEEEERAAGFGGAAFGRVSMAMADAAELQQAQAAAGPQSDTLLFFASEAHSRGIGSKLLASMGLKAGRGLGRSAQGLQQALMAAPLKRGAGLGVAGAGGTKEGAAKKRRSGKQRRRDKAAAAGAEAREASREGQRQLEQQTGSVGLFAVLNSIVGDSSAAQTVRNERLGIVGRGGDGGAAAGGASRQGHLFAGGSGAKAAPKEEDRRALSKRADDLAQLRQKVQQLSEMATRNAKDKVMLPQIRRALGEAHAALAAAEGAHAASAKAIHDREKLKKMHKF